MHNWMVSGVLLLCLAPWCRAEDEGEEPGEGALEKPVTLTMEKATLRQVITAISKDTGLRYMALDSVLDSKQTVSMNIKDLPAERVLEFLAERLHLEYDFDQGTLWLGGSGKQDNRTRHAPQLDHNRALQTVRKHPQVAALLKAKPWVDIRVRWRARDRVWVANLMEGGEDDEGGWLGRVVIGEFDKQRPKVVEVELRRKDRRQDPAPKPEEGEKGGIKDEF